MYISRREIVLYSDLVFLYDSLTWCCYINFCKSYVFSVFCIIFVFSTRFNQSWLFCDFEYTDANVIWVLYCRNATVCHVVLLLMLSFLTQFSGFVFRIVLWHHLLSHDLDISLWYIFPFSWLWQNTLYFCINVYMKNLLITSDISWHLTFHDIWHFMASDTSWHLTFHDTWHFMTSGTSWHLTRYDGIWHFTTADISWHLTFHDIWHFMTSDIFITLILLLLYIKKMFLLMNCRNIIYIYIFDRLFTHILLCTCTHMLLYEMHTIQNLILLQLLYK